MYFSDAYHITSLVTPPETAIGPAVGGTQLSWSGTIVPGLADGSDSSNITLAFGNEVEDAVAVFQGVLDGDIECDMNHRISARLKQTNNGDDFYPLQIALIDKRGMWVGVPDLYSRPLNSTPPPHLTTNFANYFATTRTHPSTWSDDPMTPNSVLVWIYFWGQVSKTLTMAEFGVEPLYS